MREVPDKLVVFAYSDGNDSYAGQKRDVFSCGPGSPGRSMRLQIATKGLASEESRNV